MEIVALSVKGNSETAASAVAHIERRVRESRIVMAVELIAMEAWELEIGS